MRCPICGEADAACGAAPLRKPAYGEETNRRVSANGKVVDVKPQKTPAKKPVADVQVDD